MHASYFISLGLHLILLINVNWFVIIVIIIIAHDSASFIMRKHINKGTANMYNKA